MSSQTLALCVPAYNASEHLPRLLKSAQDQTSSFDEILVYDDCSTDNTAEVARSFGAEVIRGRENQGCSVGRKRLAEHATSDWIHFHDADDELLPKFVAEARKWMSKDNPPEVVLFGYEYRRDEDNELLLTQRFDSEALRDDPIEYTIRTQINPFCGIYHRESFLEAGGPDTDPKVLNSEDQAMHCKLARAGLRFDADPTVTVVNYKMEASMTIGNPEKCARSEYHVLEKCAKYSGDTHGDVIARELWQNAGILGAYLQWDLADRAVQLAAHLGGRVPSHGGVLFRLLGSIHPTMALRLREVVIRILSPQLRDPQKYPKKALSIFR